VSGGQLHGLRQGPHIKGCNGGESLATCGDLIGSRFKPEIDRYHFVESDTDISKYFPPIFGQLPIFDWPPIPIFQKLLTDILVDILTKCILIKVGVDCLQSGLTNEVD